MSESQHTADSCTLILCIHPVASIGTKIISVRAFPLIAQTITETPLILKDEMVQRVVAIYPPQFSLSIIFTEVAFLLHQPKSTILLHIFVQTTTHQALLTVLFSHFLYKAIYHTHLSGHFLLSEWCCHKTETIVNTSTADFYLSSSQHQDSILI